MPAAPGARMNCQVDCGAFRLNVTTFRPFVFTLFRFESRDDGVFAAACLTTCLLRTRSNENFTSAESKSEPSWNLTPRRRVQRHVRVFPAGLQFVASDGWSFAPFLASYNSL